MTEAERIEAAAQAAASRQHFDALRCASEYPAGGYRFDTEDKLSNEWAATLALFRDVAAGMLGRRYVWQLHRLGGFDHGCSNRRQLFADLHGATLPTEPAALDAAIIAHVGEYPAALWGAAAEFEGLHWAEIKAAKTAALKAARLDGIRTRLAAGRDVSGADLVDVARAAGIEVAPRTVGTARAVDRIGNGSAEYTKTRNGGRRNLDGVFALYHATREALTANATGAPAPATALPEVTAADCAHLFGGAQ